MEGMTRKEMTNFVKSAFENDLKIESGLTREEHLLHLLPIKAPIFVPQNWGVKEGMPYISLSIPH